MAAKSLLLLAVTMLALWIGADGQLCACQLSLDYVCGADGITYDNECSANCNGVAVSYTGQCEFCPCPRILLPVCGTNGLTYNNECLLQCAGATLDYEGECVPDTGDDKDKLTKEQKRLIKLAWKLCKKGE